MGLASVIINNWQLRSIVRGAELENHDLISAYSISHQKLTATSKYSMQIPIHTMLTRRLIVIHIYPLQLQFTVTLITASGVDSMLITDHLPKLKCTKCLTNECWKPTSRPFNIHSPMMQQFSHLSPLQTSTTPIQTRRHTSTYRLSCKL